MWVEVIERIGSATYARCRAEQRDADTLAVVTIDENREMRIYHAGEWARASAEDEHGLLNHFAPETPVEPIGAEPW